MYSTGVKFAPSAGADPGFQAKGAQFKKLPQKYIKIKWHSLHDQKILFYI